MQKKWEDYTHEERLESFAKYAKFQITSAIGDNLKVWENSKEESQTLRPYSAINGKFHHGLNSIFLETEAKRKGYQNGAWITQQQAKMLGVKIKEGEQGVKIAYIKQYETQIKKDEKGNPIKIPQLDKEGNPKINPKTGEAYWRYATEQVKLDQPILETSFLYHQSQCDNLDLSKCVTPNLTNNAIEIKEPIISDKIGLFSKTKDEIKNYLKVQQEEFLKSQGVSINRTMNDRGILIGENFFIDNKMNGVQRAWHDNGKLKSEVNCVDDKYNGIKREYSDDGKLRSETHYKMDKRGIFKEYNQEGKIIKEMDFNKITEELKDNSPEYIVYKIMDMDNTLKCVVDSYMQYPDLQFNAEKTEEQFKKIFQKKGGYEFALNVLQEYKSLYKQLKEDNIGKEDIGKKLEGINKKIEEFGQEKRQKQTQKRVSPQVRAEQEKKTQRQARGK